MEDKLKKLILLMELKNEDKFSSFTESLKQLDKQGFELMSDIKLLSDELSNIDKKINDTELKNEIESLKESIKDIQLQKGDTGEKGDKGDTGEKGKDGLNGRDGIDGLDGLNGKDGENGKDGSPDTPEQIVEKINTLKNVIERKTIKGLDTVIDKPELDRAIDILDRRTQYLINKTVVQPNLSGYVPTTRTLTINGTAYDLSADRTWSVGTVTSVAALTLGTSGTDLSSSVATGTTTPVITLNVPTASATNRGALSSTDWSTFNAKESALTFSTGLTRTSNTITANLSTGIAGGQSVIGGTASGNNLTLSSTSNATKGKILFGTSAYDEVNNQLGIGTNAPSAKLEVRGISDFWGLQVGNGTVGALFQVYGGKAGFVGFNGSAYNSLDIRSGISTQLFLATNGNVGIGSSAPSQKLQVQVNDTGTTFPIFVRNANAFGATGIGFVNEANGDWVKAGIVHHRNGAGYGVGDLKFLVNSDVNTATTTMADTKMTIRPSGAVGIGTTTPSAVLHLKAGTATASTAPLKFTAGTNLTTAEAGAFEYDGTSLFFTPSSTRYNVLMNGLGLAGGQTIVGGTASGENLTLSSTSNATKGKILFGNSAYDEVNNRLGIGISSPVVKLHVLTGTYIAPISDTNYVVQNSGQYVAEYIGTNGGYAGFLVRGTGAGTQPFVQYYNSSTGKIWTQMMTTAGDLNILKGSALGTTLLTLGNNLNVGIANATPTARLHLGAGTATANTAPLKFTSGTNLTTPEAGAMEYDGTSLYFSPSTTRRTVVLDTATQTLTNKRINPRVQAVTSASTVTPSADNDDEVVITAQGAALTLANWSGTPVQGQAIIIRIKDDGTARAITFDTLYRAVGAYLPTTTVIGKTVYIACIYNSTDTKIDVVSVAQEI